MNGGNRESLFQRIDLLLVVVIFPLWCIALVYMAFKNNDWYTDSDWVVALSIYGIADGYLWINFFNRGAEILPKKSVYYACSVCSAMILVYSLYMLIALDAEYHLLAYIAALLLDVIICIMKLYMLKRQRS